MSIRFRKTYILFAALLFVITSGAQETKPSPEVEQMDRHAQEYVAIGNYKEAITIYRQAIVLAPANVVLYKHLAMAFYPTANYSDEEQLLQPLVGKPQADEECFWLLANCQLAQRKLKEAKTTLKKGLSRFPSSGMLYHTSGVDLVAENKPEAALDAWVEGIHKDPAYPDNYYDAARAYLATQQVTWGLLYGEIYLNITQDTVGQDTFKKMLFTGYKTMFDNIAAGAKADFGQTSLPLQVNSFMDAVQQIYLSLTPVVSDGITTENLTMVRIRFLMDWNAKYAAKYPYALFSYQDYLVRNGLFDIYNEWLFGKAESITEYNAWIQFHPVEMAIFLEKRKAHALQPLGTEMYDDVNMDGIQKE